ncbi:integrin alpha [Dactylosporangium sp. NPDC049742]|uniref:integrin alpha n=1 Tax=Dactylosporangium sp. NPDC049742 TaxID=3154737 RepID=UPI00342EC58A
MLTGTVAAAAPAREPEPKVAAPPGVVDVAAAARAKGLSAAELAASERARTTGVRVPVDSLTTETTRVWALPQGGFQAEIAGAVERFRRDGQWVEVDLTLHRGPDGSIAPAAHPGDLRIAGARKETGETDLASVTAAGQRVGMRWTGALPEPVLEGAKATYVEALPGVDLVVEATRTGVEQFLIVKSRAAVDSVRRVTVPITGPGIASQALAPDGSLVLRDTAGKDVAYVPAPQMWDSQSPLPSGEPRRKQRIRPSVQRRGAGVDVALDPDTTWMLDPQTVFPVVIDPVLTPAPAVTFDTYVREGDSTTHSTAGDLWLGYISGSRSRSFVHWDSAALIGKQITASTVSFWNWWSQSCTAAGWQIWPTGPASASTNWANQPVWYDADPVLVGDQPAAESTETAGFSSACDDNWVNISGTKFFQYAADHAWSTAPMGVRAVDETDTNAFKQLRSIDNTSGTVYPKATVTYNSYPTVNARSTTPATACVTGSARPAIATSTPTLSATVGDGDGSANAVTIAWTKVGDPAIVGQASFGSVGNGATVNAAVPAGQLVEGGRYQWRVSVNDGAAVTYSSWCEFSVYVTVPPVEGCQNGVDGDFNGDGVRDTVIGDPKATYNGLLSVGVVHVVNGGTGAVTTLRQGSGGIPDTPESSDEFGRTLAIYDANRDGCADLAIGAPLEDGEGVVDSGAVFLVYGAPGGLGTGPATLMIEQGRALGQNQGTVPDSPESGDWFGAALSAGQTSTGEAFLIIGAPGEDTGSGPLDTGKVHYLRGTVNVAFDGATAGAGAGPLGVDDRLGFALASSPYHFAVARPGRKGAGDTEFAGSVCVFDHTFSGALPALRGCIDQDSTGVSGVAEAGDQFGKSIAMVPFRPVGAPAGVADSLLVVGIPGEDVGTVADAGEVQQFLVTPAGISELASLNQGSAGIAGDNEAGDAFGEVVVAVNLNPAAEASATSVLVAVGGPGEDLSATDAGEVRVFAGGTTAVADTTVYRKAASLPGAPGNRELIGAWLAANQQYLLVPSAYGTRAVYAIPWTALIAGTAVPTVTYQPGVNGLPSGAVAFGIAVG